MHRTLKVKPRVHPFQSTEPVYRTPVELSDLVYQTFNSLAHRAKLIDGTSVFANRLIREESLTREELRTLKAIITDESPEAEVSSEILGGQETLDWIESVLNPRAERA
jgi:hypothetical protein